ncbi:hypothetical protein SH580_02915 [Coraliomargarita algicola]|uniref:Uncharacterized protein n=1 Tax=Coraliomargarita algicola TaxID=3092156 RepID=A0ABZ0RNH7_9BACT|nr:hypothetical protein [Coraliomargarita sp. J2-16]WPJ96653.1 hypothetical protein SH580_02915 [Coraliomargarita sp. J2-16]
MKFRVIDASLLLLVLFWATASASVSFSSSGGVFDSLKINDEINFTVTSALEDTSFLLVLNDLFTSHTFSPDEDFLPTFVNQPTALINGSVESSLTLAWLVQESQWDDEYFPFTSGYDPLDLSVAYIFDDSISLTPGDTITLNVGMIIKQSGFDIPEPDSLSSSLVAHLIAASFDQRISDDQLISIIPEASFAIPIGMLCLATCTARMRSKRHHANCSKQLACNTMAEFEAK